MCHHLTIYRKSTFSHTSYAAFRPSYPRTLYTTILSYHHGPRNLLVDLGCGHGVVARSLSKDFNHVIGTDPSAGMIAQAKSSASSTDFANVEFCEALAEDLPFIADGSVDMVVAGQAAHWFDYPRLWPEMRRIVRRGGTLAFWGYKDHVFVDYPAATRILMEWAYGMDKERLGPYWSQPGRSIVEGKLRAIMPPAEDWEDETRVDYEPGTRGRESGEGTLFMSRRLRVGECKEYVRTWSAYHGWQEAHPGVGKRAEGGKGDVVDAMFDEIVQAEGWESEEMEVDIEWGSGLLMARRR